MLSSTTHAGCSADNERGGQGFDAQTGVCCVEGGSGFGVGDRCDIGDAKLVADGMRGESSCLGCTIVRVGMTMDYDPNISL